MNAFLGVGSGDTVCGLNAREAVVETYAKCGYTNQAWSVLACTGPVDPDALLVENPGSVQLIPAKDIPLEQILAYDQIIHPGVSRPLYWERCLVKKGVFYLVALDEQNVVGFGGIRPSAVPGQHHVSPLYADSLCVAELLLKTLLQKAAAQNICVEAVGANPDIKEFVSWLNVTSSGDHTLVRQYTGEEAFFPREKVFGLAESDAFFV